MNISARPRRHSSVQKAIFRDQSSASAINKSSRILLHQRANGNIQHITKSTSRVFWFIVQQCALIADKSIPPNCKKSKSWKRPEEKFPQPNFRQITSLIYMDWTKNYYNSFPQGEVDHAAFRVLAFSFLFVVFHDFTRKPSDQLHILLNQNFSRDWIRIIENGHNKKFLVSLGAICWYLSLLLVTLLSPQHFSCLFLLSISIQQLTQNPANPANSSTKFPNELANNEEIYLQTMNLNSLFFGRGDQGGNGEGIHLLAFEQCGKSQHSGRANPAQVINYLRIQTVDLEKQRRKAKRAKNVR